MNTLYWLVKREIWEHKGGFVRAPLIGGAIFLLITIMSLTVVMTMFGSHFYAGGVSVADLREKISNHDMQSVGAILDVIMLVPTGILSVMTGIIVFFYCLGSLYDDRRDRSLLFWKSLPITDTQTVLSKVISATVIAPIVSFAVGIVTGLIVLLTFATFLSFKGVGVWELLVLAHPLRIFADLALSVPAFILWAAPTVGWLLLCSAWAKSKPFIWAVAIPLGAGAMIWWLELLGVIHGTSYFWSHIARRWLGSIFPGSWLGASENLTHTVAFGVTSDDGSRTNVVLNAIDFSHAYSILGTLNAWVGVIAGIAMIGGAIWLRRWRDDT